MGADGAPPSEPLAWQEGAAASVASTSSSTDGPQAHPRHWSTKEDVLVAMRQAKEARRVGNPQTHVHPFRFSPLVLPPSLGRRQQRASTTGERRDWPALWGPRGDHSFLTAPLKVEETEAEGGKRIPTSARTTNPKGRRNHTSLTMTNRQT